MEHETVIKIENIGKRYNIAHQQGGYISLRDVLTNILKNPFNFLKQKAKKVAGIAKNEEFWALRNISFEVKKGEVVGVIGRNGAGKSTLLKILSQITPPTEGEIKINGRVGSLLEVGTGFHPELSGRENIFLNGAILGMTREEIAKKFDDIVAFSGVEKFLDTPVKRYSSGMYVRLAFSVAAHMEPDILIIDEVLAVGDAEFQKKCLGKMDEITKKEGRTIIFVSHNMAAIQQLCKSCIWISNGNIKEIGKTEEVVSNYLNVGQKNNLAIKTFPDNQNKQVQFTKIEMATENDRAAAHFPDNEAIKIILNLEVKERIPDTYLGLILRNAQGINVLFADSRDVENSLPTNLSVGQHKLSVTIPPILAPGKYFVSLGISAISMSSLDEQENACLFEVVDFRKFRTTARPGVINLHIPWKQEKQQI